MLENSLHKRGLVDPNMISSYIWTRGYWIDC